MPRKEIKASAWTVEKPGPDQGRWRGIVLRRTALGYEVAWSAAMTHAARTAAIDHARANLRAGKVSP